MIHSFFSKRLGLGLALLLFNGCATQPAYKYDPSINRAKVPRQYHVTTSAVSAKTVVGPYRATAVSGDYAGYPALSRFIETMVQKHGFERDYLNGLFSQVNRKQWTLDYLAKSDRNRKNAGPARGSWSRYRAKFLNARHINSGVEFWRRHQSVLQRASRQYGVPVEYILGIMSVETTFGSYVGNHRVIDALTTLAFDYPRRGDYFREELENFLLMVRNENIDPAKPVGSYAGAMGLGQFMPSSFLEWAVDFNGDGKRDLWDPEDSIGSVANYFAQHGWQQGQPVVSAVRTHKTDAGLEPGLNNLYSHKAIRQAGLVPATDCKCDAPLRLLWLRHKKHDEYRLGFPNFYVITRYNHSTHYAMAVHELAQAIKRAYQNSMQVKR